VRRTFVDDETVTLSSSGSPYGGGMDFTYFLPWKYAGFRFQGAGMELSTNLWPYILGGGGVFTGAGGNTINTRFAGVNERFNNASSNVSNNRGLAYWRWSRVSVYWNLR